MDLACQLLHTEAVRRYNSSPAALEEVGMRIGRQLVERHTLGTPSLGDTLDIIKYICKEFWQRVFGKGIDNLRTNHRGVFVLSDNSFRWLQRFAPEPGVPPSANKLTAMAPMVAQHLLLPAGILRGALCHLGVDCVVEAESTRPPSCAFTVKLL